MCKQFSTESYFPNFSMFMSMSITPTVNCTCHCYLQKIQQQMLLPSSCRISLIYMYFLHIFTNITVFDNLKRKYLRLPIIAAHKILLTVPLYLHVYK